MLYMLLQFFGGFQYEYRNLMESMHLAVITEVCQWRDEISFSSEVMGGQTGNPVCYLMVIQEMWGDKR